MKQSFATVLKDYKEWLIDNMVSRGSAASYAGAYVPMLVKKVLSPFFAETFDGLDPYECFNNSSAKASASRLILAASEEIVEKELMKDSPVLAKKTLSNYRSGIRAFFNYMSEEGLYFDTSLTASQREKMHAFVVAGSTPIKYNKKELFDIFKSRLITQDRAYDRMLYCARVIHQTFNQSEKKGSYNDLLAYVIGNTKFLIEEGGVIRLNDIYDIVIYPSKRVVVHTDDKSEHTLYTLNADGARVLLRAMTAEDLSIDHDEPLENLLNNAEARRIYPRLKEVGDYYAAPCTDHYLTGCPKVRDFSHKSPICFKRYKDALTAPVFVEGLFNDLERLYKEKISFTIMLKSYNSSKGKGGKR